MEEAKAKCWITYSGRFDHFLPFLLNFLQGQSCFCFGFFRTIDLAIGKAESKSKKVVISFFKYFL